MSLSQIAPSPRTSIGSEQPFTGHERAAEFALAADVAGRLHEAFGTPLAIVHGTSGQSLIVPAAMSGCDWNLLGPLCKSVARGERSEFLDDDDSLMILALPIDRNESFTAVGVGVFLAAGADRDRAVERASRVLGFDELTAADWVDRQPQYTPVALERLAATVLKWDAADMTAEQQRAEVNTLAMRISATYEEITLLYRLTQNLMITRSDEDLCRHALGWMDEVIPAMGMAIRLAPLPDADPDTPGLRTEHKLITFGDCPIDDEQFGRLVDHFQLKPTSRPVVVNQGVTHAADWPFAGIEQLVLVPVADGECLYGWLAAINRRGRGEFGTDEAQLLASVATILGTHAQNVDLYRQQADLLAGVVRALTSAIDAKDPYTCGHSDRVARASVRLGQALGVDNEELKTLYLSGLLHDIGKIGIDENVLRKPGALTPAEYEHIKKHPEIGYNILQDLKKLAAVLPGVRFHHEAWDGSGYPLGLAGENIPFLARIMAVADAFDAMGSDRPYRKGMEDAKLDAIMRKGAGSQWDARIVAAFFEIRDDMREIAQRTPDDMPPEMSPAEIV